MANFTSYTAPGKSNNPVPIQNGNGNLYNSMPSATRPDEYSQLYPMALAPSSGSGAVNFPGVLFREEASNSLSVHTYPNLPNARVENMGQDPTKYYVRAVFTNNIYPGINETWRAGTLFPNNPDLNNYTSSISLLRNMLQSSDNKVFTHPLDGDVVVQVVSWSFELVGDKHRDGCFFDIHLITTIPDDQPLSKTISSSGRGVTQAANNVTAAYNGLINYNVNPPGLSLGGFFTQIANTITTILAVPSQQVNAINSLISTTSFAVASGVNNIIGGALLDSPAYLINNTISTIQNSKTVLGSTVSTALAAAGSEVTYDASLYETIRSVLSINNQTSANATQFFQNVSRALTDLQNYYINTNNENAAPMIAALRQMNYQVLQQASSLNTNSSNNQNVSVLTYLTTSSMTFPALASLLHQSVDSILSLNQDLINQLFVPANQTVYYYGAL